MVDVFFEYMRFLVNDYDFMRGRKRIRQPNPELKEKIKAQIINLI